MDATESCAELCPAIESERKVILLWMRLGLPLEVTWADRNEWMNSYTEMWIESFTQPGRSHAHLSNVRFRLKR